MDQQVQACSSGPGTDNLPKGSRPTCPNVQLHMSRRVDEDGIPGALKGEVLLLQEAVRRVVHVCRLQQVFKSGSGIQHCGGCYMVLAHERSSPCNTLDEELKLQPPLAVLTSAHVQDSCIPACWPLRQTLHATSVTLQDRSRLFKDQQAGMPAHLVQVLKILQAIDLGLADIGNLKVGVQGGCELERLVTGVEDAEVCAQLLSMQGDAVHCLEGIRPAEI